MKWPCTIHVLFACITHDQTPPDHRLLVVATPTPSFFQFHSYLLSTRMCLKVLTVLAIPAILHIHVPLSYHGHNIDPLVCNIWDSDIPVLVSGTFISLDCSLRMAHTVQKLESALHLLGSHIYEVGSSAHVSLGCSTFTSASYAMPLPLFIPFTP